MQIGSTKISIILGDITTQNTDAIVNAANPTLLGGGGVDGAIHHAAGPKLLEECRTLHGCLTGEAKITRGYNLPAKYIIHTVGPIYYKYADKNEAARLLADCYRNALKLAMAKGLKIISFPSIATGIYGYPIKEAIVVVKKTLTEFLQDNNYFKEIRFILHGQEDLNIYSETLK